MMKLLSFGTLALAGCCFWGQGEKEQACAVSPDGRNEIRLWTNPLAYEVRRGGEVVVAKSEIGMKVDGKCLAPCASCPVRSEVRVGTVETPVYKKDRIDLAANETFADFGDWGVRLAARNDGVAYRFETKRPGRIRVNCEKATVNVPDATARSCAYRTGGFGCEESVPTVGRIGDVRTEGKNMVYLPLTYSLSDDTTVAITDADVRDYPIWNLRRAEGGDCVRLESVFAGWPKKTHRAGDWDSGKAIASGGRWVVVDEHADHLVETEGTRTFPWRAFILGDAPKDLCGSDLVQALSAPRVGLDFSWVRPGKVAWDWWNCFDNQGESGCNTKTYERFIDFAAKTGVEYVIFDEGWSETLNIWKFHKDVDVPHLIKYANEKGVGIILWMAWAQIVGDEERVASHFAKLGAKGFKVDFMDRGDAEVERFLWKFADACARNRMVVDYHGAHRPTGMSRAYPNVLNYEGVHGLEQMKFFKGEDMMQNDVAAFFGRLTAGPMDYTPGAMDNYPVGKYPKKTETFNPHVNPGSEGTRCRQMAMMILYEAPLQMLSDSPTKYEKNMECFSFMAATPVVWSDTVGLGGCPRRFAAAARKSKDGSWYAAAIASGERQDVTIDTDFLGDGRWSVESFSDADDAAVHPTHYVHSTGGAVKRGDKLSYRLAPGGGLV
ncbi:MAG: glycoside hydrolase family 97 catalytic domain-containing protein, partial [bacterium]|nr:glycoside hydrolase family 97 catalytic domain-containing protein [Candidatus Colisoma equi]